jgi:hypothetical protein
VLRGAALVSIAVLGFAPGRAQIAEPDSSAVMRIDGEAISADEFGRWLIDVDGARLARSFAEQWLVVREAERRGIAPPAQAVDERIDAEVADRVRGAFLGRREDWLAELARLGRSEGGHRAQRRAEVEPLLAATELARSGRVVPEEKIRRDFELLYGPEGKDYELRGILFRVEVETPPPGTPREEAEARRRRAFETQLARALATREKLLAGASFEQLARELSDDEPSRARGGALEPHFRPPGWNAPLVEAVLRLAPGEISPPVYAKGGYWLLQAVACAVTPYDSVREEIERRLIELGPEQDEIGDAWNRVIAGMRLEILPGMYEAPALADEVRAPRMGLAIDGEPVPRSEFALWLLHSRGESRAGDFAEAWLVERKARASGIDAAPAEVEARLRAHVDRLVASSYGGSRDAWRDRMARSGRTEDGVLRDLRARLRVDLLCEKLILAEREVTPELVRERFAREFGQRGRWLEVRAILLALPAPAGDAATREDLDGELAAKQGELLARAASLARRLRAGEDFATLARAFSDDAGSAAQGGRLEGRFQPDAWPRELAEAVLALDVGEISEPLDSRRGFAIFEVVSAREVRFEEVAAELERELREAPVPAGDLAAYRNVLRKQASIEVLPAMYR